VEGEVERPLAVVRTNSLSRAVALAGPSRGEGPGGRGGRTAAGGGAAALPGRSRPPRTHPVSPSGRDRPGR